MLYLAIDTETGGLTPACSLLTASFQLFTEVSKKPLAVLDLALEPDDGAPYRVHAEAMSINKIDLADLSAMAITYKDAGVKLISFLESLRTHGAYLPLGHNIGFDLDFITTYLIPRNRLTLYTGYRFLDTAPIALMCKDLGLLPNNLSISLSSLATHFGIPCDEKELHQASYDGYLTKEVYVKLKQLCKK